MLMNDLSIIIPFYNTPINFIDYLIEKSRLESYPQYEIIWIDDGSDFAISNYVKDGKNSKIYFCGNSICLEISYYCLENQIFRATMLESLIRRRKDM